MEPVAVKEIKDVAVAIGKVSASLITSFQDGKFVLMQDGFNFVDDIPAILNAVEGASLVKGELDNLTQAQRAEIKAAVIDTVLKDVGGTYDEELLLAVGDIAEAVLAIIFLVARKQEELPQE